jgi:hypothetical protein
MLAWRHQGGQVLHLAEEAAREPAGWRVTSSLAFLPAGEQEVICLAHTDGSPQALHSAPVRIRIRPSPQREGREEREERKETTFKCEYRPDGVTCPWTTLAALGVGLVVVAAVVVAVAAAWWGRTRGSRDEGILDRSEAKTDFRIV